MNSVRRWFGCLVVAGCLTRAETVVVYAASGPALSIILEDRAHVGMKALVPAENLQSAILLRAGVLTRWTTLLSSDRKSLFNDFRNESSKTCGVPLDNAEIRAVILPRAPGGFPSYALGFASPCARDGFQVTVYADRIEAVSRGSSASFYRVLAYALAHESGHVLLRSGVHESSGLMKAIWDKNDWQRAAVELIPFSAEEEAWIRHSRSVLPW